MRADNAFVFNRRFSASIRGSNLLQLQRLESRLKLQAEAKVAEL